MWSTKLKMFQHPFNFWKEKQHNHHFIIWLMKLINHQVLTSLPKEALLSSTNVSTFLPLPWSGGSNLAEISTTPQYNHPRTWKACSVTIVPTMEVLITSEGPNGQMRSRACEKGAGLWLTPSNLVSHHRYSLHCCHWDNNQLRVTVLY